MEGETEHREKMKKKLRVDKQNAVMPLTLCQQLQKIKSCYNVCEVIFG